MGEEEQVFNPYALGQEGGETEAGSLLLGGGDGGNGTGVAALPSTPTAVSPALPTLASVTATPTAAAPTVGTSTGALGVGDRVTTLNPTGDSISLRVTPSMIAVRLATVPNGSSALITRGPATAEGYTWYEIETSEGTGWTRSDFLKRT